MRNSFSHLKKKIFFFFFFCISPSEGTNAFQQFGILLERDGSSNLAQFENATHTNL